MKKRRHNSQALNAGVDPRALKKAAALLVEAIGAAIAERYPSGHAPVLAANPASITFTAGSVPAPARTTREEVEKIAARLIVLGRGLACLDLPLTVAGAWLPLSDAAAFADRAEEHVRGLLNLFDEYLATHPDALATRGLPRNTVLTTELELEGARKHIAKLDRVAAGTIELEIGPHYLPPEFRPEGLPRSSPTVLEKSSTRTKATMATKRAILNKKKGAPPPPKSCFPWICAILGACFAALPFGLPHLNQILTNKCGAEKSAASAVSLGFVCKLLIPRSNPTQISRFHSR